MGMLVELNQSGISKPHALVFSPGLLVRRSHARVFFAEDIKARADYTLRMLPSVLERLCHLTIA